MKRLMVIGTAVVALGCTAGPAWSLGANPPNRNVGTRAHDGKYYSTRGGEQNRHPQYESGTGGPAA
jgi:hypothetical protein